MACPKRNADDVENQQLGPVPDLRRDAVVGQFGGEFGKQSGDGGHGVFSLKRHHADRAAGVRGSSVGG